MKGKRIISVVLCLLLSLSLLPVGALAEGEDPAAPALTSDPTDPQTDPEPGEDLEDPVADVDDEDPPADVDDDDPVADLDDEDPPAPVEPQDDGPAAKDGDVYVVAGSANENLSQGGVPTPIFGTAWDGTLSANQMTLSGSVYTKTYTVAVAYTVEFKVVKNGETWYGNGESNIHLDLPAGCKFTVTFNPSTNAVSASVAMDYTSVYVASDLLNDWQADGQAMTQKQPGIWETQLQVPAGSHGFKFTIDGSWDRNFGRGLYQSTFVTGQEREAKWNGSDNMMLNFDAATTVTLRLNLTNFNYQTKSGAKYGVFVQDNTFNITLNATLDGVQGTPFYEGGGYTVADNTGEIRLLEPVDNMYRPEASAEGTLVRFRVTVPNGYSCTVTVTDAANNAITPTAGETTTDNQGRAVTEYSFYLPAADVNILAAFSGQAAPILHTITLRPSLYAPGASTAHVMTEDEKTEAIQTLTIEPPQAYAGETVTMTVIPNPGYFIKNDNYGTYAKVDEYTYEYVVQESNSVEIVLSIALAHELDDGCWLQIDAADQADWIYMDHVNLFVEDGNQVDYLWQTKQTLTAGQTLKVYYVSNPGAEPALKATCTVTADDLANGKTTVYYANSGSANEVIHLCCLNGYYISWADQNPTHMDSTGHWTRYNIRFPYETNDTHKFTACGETDAYVKEEELTAGKNIKVAHFVDGTVDHVWGRWGNANIVVPYEGFSSGYTPGVVFFRPSQGVISILPVYALTNGSPDLCTLGAPAYCLDADNNALMKFTLTPLDPNASIETVTVTAEGGTAVTATKNGDYTPPTTSPKTEEYVVALPAAAATVTVTMTLPQPFTITSTATDCTVADLPGSAYGDDEITFTVTPDANLDPSKTIQVTAQDTTNNAAVTVTRGENNSYSFTMPAGNVTVTAQAVDKPTYTITAAGNGCTVTDIPTSAYEGQTVTFLLTPISDLVTFSSLTIVDANNEAVLYTENEGVYSFTMPAGNVTVTATFTAEEGYYLIRIPAGAQGVSLTDTLYWLEITHNANATFGEEYMSEDMSLANGDKLFVARVLADGTVQAWNNAEGTWGTEFSLSSPAYTVDENHANEHAKVYFRQVTPNPETHPFWQDFGGHLFVAIAREIDVATGVGVHGDVTASPVTGVYSETITLTVTPETGYQLKSLTVTYTDSSSTEQTITPEDRAFTMPDYPVTVHAAFCLADGYYLLGSMHDNNGVWDVNNLTPAMKFSANPENADEYMLVYSGFAAEDEFKVVRLVNGDIAENGWFGTSLTGHSNTEGNYVINDQTGDRTVYFRPNWNNDWSGHIWIGDAPQDEYDAFVYKFSGYLGDIQELRYIFVVKNEYTDKLKLSLTVGGSSRNQVTTEEQFYMSRRACWMFDTLPASMAYDDPNYTTYYIRVKVFAKQYDKQCAFTVTSGDYTLNVRSYQNDTYNVPGVVDTVLSYSMVDLMNLYYQINQNRLGEKWTELAEAMAAYAVKLRAVE